MIASRLNLNKFAFALALTGLAAGCSQDINAPQRGVNPLPAENYKSDLSASIHFLYKDVAASVDRALPKTYSNTTGAAGCQAAKIADCSGVTATVTVTRPQNVVVTKGTQPSSMNVSIPVTATGAVTAAGLASPVNFEFGAQLKLAVLTEVGADWCPKLTVNGTYEFTQQPRVELRPGVFVNISIDQAPSLQQLNEEANNIVAKEINCAEFQKQATNLWAKRDVPVDVDQLGAMNLRVAPESIKMTDAISSDESLDFAFFVSGQLNLTKATQPVQQQSLPALAREPASGPGQLTAKLPLVIDYASIDRAMNKTLEQASKMVVNAGVGTAEITLKQISSYPSFDDVIVVINFYADIAGALPSTKGVVYLIVTPLLESNGKVIRMTNVRVATSLSNDIYRSLNLELSKSIRKKIEKYLVFDATKEIEKLVGTINKQLTTQSEALSMQLKLQDPSLGMVRLALTEEGVLLVSQFTTTPQVTLPVTLPGTTTNAKRD